VPRYERGPPVLRPAIGTVKVIPIEVITDRAATYPIVLDELLLRGLKQDRNAGVVIAGHAFIQNLRRGHYELAVEEQANRRLTVAFNELAMVI